MGKPSPYPKCPVCHSRHDPRRITFDPTDAAQFKVINFVDAKLFKVKFDHDTHRVDACYFDPKRSESYAQIEARMRDPKGCAAREKKIANLRRLAQHPNTPPHEARAAREAMERLNASSSRK